MALFVCKNLKYKYNKNEKPNIFLSPTSTPTLEGPFLLQQNKTIKSHAAGYKINIKQQSTMQQDIKDLHSNFALQQDNTTVDSATDKQNTHYS